MYQGKLPGGGNIICTDSEAVAGAGWGRRAEVGGGMAFPEEEDACDKQGLEAGGAWPPRAAAGAQCGLRGGGWRERREQR